MNQLNITTEAFKKNLTQVEIAGMKELISKHFNAQFGFEPIPLCYVTTIGDYRGLTYQNNETEVSSGIILSSFALTENGQVVAVCFDQNDDYVFYAIN